MQYSQIRELNAIFLSFSSSTCWLCWDFINFLQNAVCFRATFTSLPNARSMSYNELENTNNAMYRHEIFVSNQKHSRYYIFFFLFYPGLFDILVTYAASIWLRFQASITFLTYECEVRAWEMMLNRGIKNMKTQHVLSHLFLTFQICLHFNETHGTKSKQPNLSYARRW